jgi:hypothetical protein
LRDALLDKQNLMAMLGAAVFAGHRKGVEAAETHRIRSSGDTSLLLNVVAAVEAALQIALTYAARWTTGASGGVHVNLNRDLVDSTLDAQTLSGLVQAYVAGILPLESFLFNLKQVNLLEPTVIIADEAVKLAKVAANGVSRGPFKFDSGIQFA